MSATLKYRPEIDGLRGIAVLGVIIFHANKTLLPGGYLGVDVFFVISGFLITSIILREMAEGNFRLRDFWARRIKRILPVAAFVLLAVSVIQSFVIFRPDILSTSDQKLAALLFYANIFFWKDTGDYWGLPSEESPFIHYWSLSVEEQYYLLYPLMAMMFISRGQRRFLFLLIFVTVSSFVVFTWGVVNKPTPSFYLLPTRTWELGAGCLLAFIPARFLNNKPIGAVIGIPMLLLVFLLPLNDSTLGYPSLVAVLATVLIIWSGSNRISRPLLENQVMVQVGKISFSLYLWHWPVITTLRKIAGYNFVSSQVTLTMLGVLVLAALSLLSFFLIEKQIRRHRHGVSMAFSLVALFGIYLYTIEPWLAERHYASNYERPSWHGRYYDLKPSGELTTAFNVIAGSVDAPFREASPTAFKEGGIIRQRTDPQPRVVVIGDSHAVMWSKLVDDITGELDLTTSFWSMNGESGLMHVPPVQKVSDFLDGRQYFDYDYQRQQFIEIWKPDVVVVALRWNPYLVKKAEVLFDFIGSHAGEVIIVESPPVLSEIGNRSAYQFLSYLGRDDSTGPNERQLWPQEQIPGKSKAREQLLKIVEDRPNFHFLPTADLFLSEDSVIVSTGRKFFYVDDDHLSNEGAWRAHPRFWSVLHSATNEGADSFPVLVDNDPNTGNRLLATANPQED